ncbi:MAG: leucine-rich repeat protein [Clostridia bacterium]|nr:leucine-rich repeat protein [Clostridia bacterium]
MKLTVKRTLSVILSAVMVLALAATGFAAAKNQTFDRSTTGTEKVITGYTADGTENGVLSLEAALKATEKVDGKFVIVDYTFTGVAANAFNPNDASVNMAAREFLATVKELVVAEGIADIGENAFANLPNLEKVTFKGDANVGRNAFLNCPKLKEVTFEKNAVVGAEAFYGCDALKKVAFAQDADLDKDAFKNADNLEEVIFSENGSVKGVNALANTAFVKNYPVDFVMNGSTLVYYKGNDEEVTIPLNVTAIGDGAFAGNTHLKTVNITKYVDTLGDSAFEGCTALENVNFATFGSIENIGADVFTDTPYYDDFDGDFFTIGTVLIKYLGEDEHVDIPNTVTSIAPDCFMGCYASADREDDDTKSGYTWVVSSIFVPASVKQLGDNCFALEQLEDGSYYVPTIYAYENTEGMTAVKEAGYDVTVMPALGDVDGDGEITAEDARRALRLSVHLDYDLEPQYVHAADVNGDEKVTAEDARTILRLAIELENYTPEDLLYMPMTKTEILMAYINAVDVAIRYNAGYTKASSSVVTGSDMCPAASANFYSTLSGKGAVNETKTYAPKTKEALDNLFISAPVSEKNIASATCTLSENGKYTINIKFKDVADNFGDSAIVKVLPAKTRGYFASSFTGKSWWNGTRESNAVTKFDLSYNNCAISAVLDRDTNKLESVKQTVGYRFNVDGRINGLAISSNMWKTGDATLDRLEEVNYTQFIYNPIVNDRT